MIEERRATKNSFDVTGTVAIVYTVGFFTMGVLLYFFKIPAENKEVLLYLFGILSGIEISIASYLFGSNKNAEAVARSTEQRQGRSEAVVQEIAKAAAPVAAAAVAAATGTPAVTPAPMNPATGVVPAQEVAT